MIGYTKKIKEVNVAHFRLKSHGQTSEKIYLAY